MSIPKVKRYENGKEIVGQVDTPYEITWDEWQLLTDAEKEKRKWLITDVPSADGFATVENMKLLWSNPSPTASFASQNITLASADYDFLLWIFKNQTSGSDLSVISKKGSGTILNYSSTNTKCCVAFRTVTYISDISFSVGNASWSLDNATPTTDNARCVPIAVYGLKQQTEIRFNALAQNVKATVDYSTDEHPIGTWIDGSTLYEKTVDFGALPNNTTKSVNHNISNLQKVYSIDGVAVSSSGTTLPIPYAVSSTLGNSIQLSVTSTQITMATGTDRSSYNGYVTLRYTKTA